MRGRGVVVEISEKNNIIVMTSHGEFLKVTFKKPVCVGQEIQFSRREPMSFWQVGVAAVFFVALFGTAGFFEGFYIPGGNAAAYFVTLDINPSIELAVNSQKRVISVDGLNAAGQDLLEDVRVIGRPLQDAVDLIGARAEKDGFLTSGHEVVVTISCLEDQNVQIAELKPSSSQNRRNTPEGDLETLIVGTLTTAYKANVKVWRIPVGMRREARLAGLTPARYIASQIQIGSSRTSVALAEPVRPTVNEEVVISPSNMLAAAPNGPATNDKVNNSTATMAANVATAVASSANRTDMDRGLEVKVNRPSLAPTSWTGSNSTMQSVYEISIPMPSRMKGEVDSTE